MVPDTFKEIFAKILSKQWNQQVDDKCVFTDGIDLARVWGGIT